MRGLALILVGLLLASAILSRADEEEDEEEDLDEEEVLPLAETRLGKVRGKWATSRGGKRYAEFKGIPYAQPPVGELRFQAAKSAKSWPGILNAFDDGEMCAQATDKIIKEMMKTDFMGSEDCLRLSLFTPDVKGKAPVIVHFHGGAFVMGTGRWYHPRYIMDQDVVVVNIQYRLGIFGFLTWETEELRGNQGLKDQVLALKWVQENIAAFGGDPHLVTIIGESAGGASVHYHTLSPLSRGLFHRGFSESGTSYAPWALQVPGRARRNAEQLMNYIGCPTELKDALPCIMKKKTKELIAPFNKFKKFGMDPIAPFGPSLEPAGPEAFLSGSPGEWTPAPVPIVMGVTSAEGLLRTLDFIQNGTDLKWLSDIFDSVAPVSLGYEDSAPNPGEVTKALREFYLPRKEITVEQDWENLTKVYSDTWFTVPVIEGANRHTGDVYFYYFDYVLEGHAGLTLQKVDPKLIIGANHVLEALFLWDLTSVLPISPEITRDLGEKVLELSHKIIKQLVHFAKNGVPHPLDSGAEWRKWTETDQYYVEVSRSGEFGLKKGLAEDRINFWKSLDYRTNFFRTVEENLAAVKATGRNHEEL